jgi:integrase
MGLRPGEIAALKWEDFDEESVHIRRAYVRGNVTTTKTPESVASLQMPNRVRLFFELWRQKCRFAERSSAGRETKLVSLVKQTGWVFENERGNPVNLKDMVSRTIRPVIEKAGLTWKSLYAGRRGAGTAIIGLTNGNYASAQELLRHKHMSTTLQFYKKQTQHALTDGIKALDAALASPSRTPM